MANALDASRLASVFAEADADGSGTINADEIIAYFGTSSTCPRMRAPFVSQWTKMAW